MSFSSTALWVSRYLFVLVAFVASMPLHSQNASRPDAASDINQLLDSLRPKDAAVAASPSRGTGFFIGENGLILTAHHILEGKTSIVVIRSPGEKEVPVQLLKADPTNDLALLLYPQTVQGLKIAHWQSVPIGLEVYVLGFPTLAPSLNSLRITKGLINGVVASNQAPPMFQLSAPIHRGDSGAPVLSPDGIVVGLVRGKLDTTKFARLTGDFPQNINLAVKSDVLYNFLDQSGFAPARVTINLMSKTPSYILYKALLPTVVVVKAR